MDLEKNSEHIKNSIKEIYKYRTELHAHTSPISSCADFSPEDVVEKYVEAGYDALTITNHFSYPYRVGRFEKEPTASEFVNWYMSDFYKAYEVGEKMGIKIILGAEIRFAENENDYLIYGINEDILKEVYEILPYGVADFKASETLKDVLIVQAHRFRNGMEYIDPSYVDGIETFNMHSGHNSRVAMTVKFAKENNFKIVTAGSDFHHEGGEGMAALRTKELPQNSCELEAVLRSCDYVFEIGENSIVLP